MVKVTDPCVDRPGRGGHVGGEGDPLADQAAVGRRRVRRRDGGRGRGDGERVGAGGGAEVDRVGVDGLDRVVAAGRALASSV